MNLKRTGKRLLYFIGGIIIVLVLVIILIAVLDTGGNWFNQITLYLCIGILLGVALIITSFSKNIDGTPQKTSDKNPGEPVNKQTI